MSATFGTLRSDVDELAGLDLEEAERDRLINEAVADLCIRTEWTRATVNLGPTVAGQEDYDIPPEVNRVLKLSVGGVPYTRGSEAQKELLDLGDLRLRGRGGLFWSSFGPTGIEQVSLYPAPQSPGQPINALSVIYPEPMTEDTDEPPVPREFRSAILDWVCAYAQGYQEDGLEARAFFQQEFDRKASSLKALRNSRVGRGPAQMQIAGYHR